MKYLNISDYKKSMYQIPVFDVLIKDEIVNKDVFLEEKEIAPTSYRRAKTKEQNVGLEIVEILAKHFKLKLVTNELVDELEKLLNEIYLDVIFRISTRHEAYLKQLDELLDQDLVISPIIELIRLFVVTFSENDIPVILTEHIEDYNYVSEFESIYNEDLLIIYNMLKLAYCKNFTKEMLAREYNNGICYSIIAINHNIHKKYYESIFFAEKAKKAYLNENNFKRAIYINFTILNNLASTANYEQYYNLAREQMLIVRSFDLGVEEYCASYKHLVASSIGAKKYNEAIDILKLKNQLTLTEVCCYTIAKYHLSSKEDFKQWCYKNIYYEENDKDYKECITYLINFLKNPQKQKITPLEKYDLMPALLEILKWSQL